MRKALGRFGGKEWRDEQLRNISDRIFDMIGDKKDKLSFEDLYIATLLVYNDINKRLPISHLDPPTEERFRELIKENDWNQDKKIGRDEFLGFILSLTSDAFISLSHRLILTLVIAPTVAVVTKRSTEGIPVVGSLVQKLPSSAYAFLVTLAAFVFQNSQKPMLK
ncbi:uncharacterized protein LOC111791228 [Cucurbita pepo subsp. pepo]|nr:uncharacterized protein LOC111791228 [Cucurbita pepo subsp. pepo]